MIQFLRKWFSAPNDRVGLDILLGQAPAPSAPLRARLDWIARLVHWIRAVGPNASELGAEGGRIQVVRLKYILLVLERNLEIKKKCAQALRSVIRDTSALEMFLNVGIPNQQGFFEEIIERIHLRVLPQAPRENDLIHVFSETLRFETDSEWIAQMDGPLFKDWLDLFHYGEEPDEPTWNTLIRDARDALFLATLNVRSMGLSHLVRDRMKTKHFSELPFYSLMEIVSTLLNAKDSGARVEAYINLSQHLEKCQSVIDQILSHFQDEGVSISLVYDTERLRALCLRVGVLARLLAGHQFGPEFIQDFFGMLVHENIRVRSLHGLFADNLHLLSRKIVETNAEVGEHYITRDRTAYRAILKKAWGGGAVTGITILFKLLLSHLMVPPFVAGFFAFLNYSVSFVGMQLLGFTLATKQPAMTATVLATKIKEGKESLHAVVFEAAHLIRSQIAAVVGNITAVIPAIVVIHYLWTLQGTPLTDEKHAREIMASFSILGLTPFYAAWTGVLLWLSSVFAGGFGNWLSYRRLPQALAQHPRLQYVFGVERTRRISEFVHTHAGGFAANISLAFLLGMSPQIAAFFGLPLDVRHVTLSTGSLTAAALEIGPRVFSDHHFWKAVLGVLSMAVLNLLVSFSLALTVALRAQRASGIKGRQIYRALLRRLLHQPLIFFFPPRTASDEGK